MNPFLEPTVAAPQPGADWRSAPRQRHPPRHAPVHPRRRRTRTAPAQPTAPRFGLGRAGRVLRAVMLAGSLLLPGLAMAVDINTATPQQLQGVKGIGPKTAGIIIEERERGGRFESIADVSERVKGIGAKKAASLQAAGLTVGSAVAAAAPDAEGGRGAKPAGARRAR